MFGLKKDVKHVESENALMNTYFADLPEPPQNGDTTEGTIVSMDKATLYVDLKPFGTGIIYGREYIVARDLIRKLHVGDSITATVVDDKSKTGYVELSLREVKQAMVWEEVEKAIAEKTPIELPVLEANKGGLLMAWQGLQGFLPASQLSAEHYPRVEDGDKNKILDELRKFVGQKFAVTIIGATQEDGKLVFSEKHAGGEESEVKKVEKYKVGDILEGEVTGAVEFGIFVKIEDNLEGLVHISELDWSLVEDPKKMFKVGDKVKVKVIEVKDGKISLSIKQLRENPWNEAAKKYKKDDVVKGIIIKYNKHGALASIEEGVAGLIHISEFESEEKLRETLELGKAYDFKITLFEAKDQKMTLSFQR
jgi:small subunit ribosomal protein S1